MHPLHIAVTVAMAISGLGALAALYGSRPHLLGLSFYLGLWVLIAAMVIALTLALCLIVRVINKQAKPFLQKAWLGLANGTVAVLFLAWFVTNVS